MEKQMKQHPDMAEQRAEMEARVYEYIAQKQAARQEEREREEGAPYITIPVVVHVVYNTSTQNISDNRIHNQIEVLNEDYRRLNSDTSATREIFKDVAADTRIEFCLATRDPNSNPTDGITRTSTSVTEFSGDDNMKFDASGGKDGWPHTEYLNIWVCNLTGGLGGYAYFPGSAPPGADGVVVDHATVPGRTTTHEVGHWLNLFHTFQGNCAGSDASTCATEGDRVCDTPQQDGASLNCNPSDNTCPPSGLPDMIENYMSYNSCQNLFTEGQSDRIEAAINIFRNSLYSSLACCPKQEGLIQAYPLMEDMEDELFPPNNWRVINPNANVSWDRTNAAGAFGNSEASALMYHYSPAKDISGASDFLYMPPIDLWNLSAPATLEFSVAYARYDNEKFDSLIVHITTDTCGESLIPIWAKGGSELATAPDQTHEFVPEADEWRKEQISLDAYANQAANYAHFQIVFETRSGWGNNMYLDNINIMEKGVGVEEPDIASSVSIYPNPAQSYIYLAFSKPSEQNMQIHVFNAIGQSVQQQTITSNTTHATLSTSALQKGIYLVRIAREDGKAIHTEKVLVTK